MKRVFLIAVVLLAAIGVKAQDCETIMLPYFRGDQDRMAEYPAEKLAWRCNYARNAFYVADEMPDKSVLYSIDEVKEKWTGVALPLDFKVDLTKLSYYAYDFEGIQLKYKDLNTTICFATPGSEHKYLVLRSLNEMYALTEFGNTENRQK
jgi:hypothetical protein